MKKLIIFSSLFVLASCNQRDIIYFGTDEFLEFEAKAYLSKEDAWETHKKFCEENDEKVYRLLFYVIDGNYVFSDFYNIKLLKATTNGIWINAESGEIAIVKDGEYIQSKGSYWEME